MSQDITTSRAGERTVGAQTEQSDIIKRRLGAWTAPMAAQTAPMPDRPDMGGATLNLGNGAPAVTAPIMGSDATMTSRLHQVTGAIPSNGGTGATRPMAEPQTVPFAASPAPAGTVPFPANGQTAQGLHPSGAMTAAMASRADNTVP
ncbi:MAG TPA: hypothetical protein VFI12_03600, partial [Thermomicrobiales bacterium]|nr:hypothetical protein [Thermomicrobiales bacterium]